ncbi:hypothetical protein [Streptomyces sp. Tue6028]|uniref:hypothetical protein n=1 Tax=Streptomyces sp. Tue6028 TaxID=2036037 RepID=UPI003D750774
MPDDILALWPLASASETDWLGELTQDDGLTGYEAPGRPDAAWVLGGMYERGETTGDSVNDAQSRDEHPGPGWERLRWTELAARIGDPVVPQGLYPCFRCFPSAKEASIQPRSIPDLAWVSPASAGEGNASQDCSDRSFTADDFAARCTDG